MKTFFIVLLFNLFVLAPPVLAKTPGEVEIGGVLREAQMQPLFGKPKKLSEFRGKPLIINVWASWCGPCRQEMGSLDRLARRYSEQFVVIGISTDDYPENARAFLQKSRVGFNNYIDSQLFLENMLGADRLPLTLLVDANGKVLGKYYGAKEWDSPEALMLIAKAFQIKM
jgi:thiol-disulfide isomerase/thioredoxin